MEVVERTESLPDEQAGSPGEGLMAGSGIDGLSVRPGACLGRYTIRARIGRGGMGEVFTAHDPELNRIVALKMLRPDVAGESLKARTRFQREAQAMARLSHPNVVAVYDVGSIGERVYVAMEMVEGPTLQAWLSDRARGWREVLDVFLQAGRGLEAAHAAGLVHRDFKPSNVIVGDRVRVADFGLARAASDAEAVGTPAGALDSVVTQTGAVLGTPAYMAPEQSAGGAPSAQSDQYSFAVALHEALTGARPGQVSGEATRSVWNRAPARIRRVVQKALSVNPSDRYPTMSDLLRDLSRVTLRDVVFGLDYTFLQRAMPLMGILAAIGQLAFYFVDGRWLGMSDSLPVRCIAALVSLPVAFFPRDTPLKTWQKLYWELSIATSLFVFPYLYLLNGNTYWYVSIVFIGVAAGFLAKALFLIPLSALTFVAAGIAFARIHGAVQGETRVVAEAYVVFLITALVMKVAALGLEMTFRRALEAEAALRQAETNIKNLRDAAMPPPNAVGRESSDR